MAANQLLIGPQILNDGNALAQARGAKTGEALVTELQPRYYENTYRGRKFYGSNGATPTVTTVALATTYTGLALINPAGSPVNLVLDKVGYSFLVVFPAVATIGLMVGWSAAGVTTSSAAASPGASSLVNAQAVPNGKCVLSATFPTAPFLHTVFGSGLTGAATTVPMIPQLVDMEGSVIIPPGGWAAIYTSTVSGAAALAASFQWTEILI